ncbi:phosphatase PAP2 family protein [Mesorhizobium australicum]|nr:phosphatase PAP2 family protein [Mesorhizobium australicum]
MSPPDAKPGGARTVPRAAALGICRYSRIRVFDNIVSTLVFLHRRRCRRRMGRIAWKWPLTVAFAIVLFTLFTIDTYFAANRLTANSPLFVQALAWTHWGKSATILVPTACLLIASSLVAWRRLRPRTQLLLLNQTAMSAYLLLSVLLSGLVVNLLKQMIGRARPSLYPELGAYHLDPWTLHTRFASFPSGHSSVAGAAAMGLALLFPALRVPALILALWLATTRVFVGSHFMSDVFAGLMIGAWFAYALAIVCASHGLLFDVSQAILPTPKKTFHIVPAGMRAEWRGMRRRYFGRSGRPVESVRVPLPS